MSKIIQFPPTKLTLKKNKEELLQKFELENGHTFYVFDTYFVETLKDGQSETFHFKDFVQQGTMSAPVKCVDGSIQNVDTFAVLMFKPEGEYPSGCTIPLYPSAFISPSSQLLLHMEDAIGREYSKHTPHMKRNILAFDATMRGSDFLEAIFACNDHGNEIETFKSSE